MVGGLLQFGVQGDEMGVVEGDSTHSDEGEEGQGNGRRNGAAPVWIHPKLARPHDILTAVRCRRCCQDAAWSRQGSPAP